MVSIKLGIEIYEICNETENFAAIFDLYQDDQKYFLGIVSSERLHEKVTKFCDVLDIQYKSLNEYDSFPIKASVQFLSSMGWMDNVTVFAPQERLIEEFLSYSKTEFICIKDCKIYG